MKTISSILIMLILVVVGLVGCSASSLAPTAVSTPISDTDALRQVIQLGHSDRINSAVFSPDSRFVVTGSQDNTLKLWEVATGKEIRTFIGHGGIVKTVVFSPNGLTLLSGSDDNTIKLWDITTGKELRTFTVHFDQDSSVAFSPNGQRFVSSSIEEKFVKIKLWDVATGKVLHTFSIESPYYGSSVIFSPDISFALIQSGDNVLEVEVSTGKKIRTFSDSNLPIVFSRNGRFVLSQSHENNTILKLWELATGKEIHKFTFSYSGDVNEAVEYCLASFSSNEKWIVSSCMVLIVEQIVEMQTDLWDVSTGKKIRTLTTREGDRRNVKGIGGAVAFSPDDRFIVFGGEDRTMQIWRVPKGQQLQTISGHTAVDSTMQFSRDDENRNIFAGLIWKRATGQFFETDVPYYSKTIANFSSGIEAAGETVGITTFSPDRDLALTAHGSTLEGDLYGSLKLWDVATGKKLHTLIDENKLDHLVTSVVFSPNGRFALSGSATYIGGLLELWELLSGKKLRTFANDDGTSINSVDFSPDGHFALLGLGSMALGGMNGSIKLWDVTTWKEVRTFIKRTASISSVRFSPDGRLALSGGWDNTLKLWDVATGKELRVFTGHSGPVNSIAFSPDGRLARSESQDGTTRLWDIASGQLIVTMLTNSGGEWIVYTPDGYYNTSPEGKSAVHYASATETYGFEQFESFFRRPDIIKARLAGDLKAGTPAPKLTRPPRVTAVQTALRQAQGATTDQATYPLSVTATSHDDLVQTVRVFVNGKPALEKPVDAKEQRLDFDVPLFAGPNRITTVAYDRKGFSSNQASIDIISTVPGAKKPTLFVMAVGISQYPKMSKGDQLDYAHTDAQNLVKTLRQQKGQLFADVRDFTITNKEATPRAITDGLHALSAMDANDIAIIFFAGHGVQSKDGRFWYVTQQGSLKQPESGGLDWQTLNEHFNRIKGRVILFLDACHSGSITDETIVPNDQLATKFFKGGMGGVMVFSASKGRQTSLEKETIGGGLFTHYLTQGLTAKETDRDNNGFVEFMELVDYVSKAVNEKTSGQQTPWLSRRELFGDLAVATVQSSPQPDVTATLPEQVKPTLHVLAVGISEYPKIPKSLQLDYAHTDAQNLVKTLRQQKGQLFADVRDFTLTNKEATPRAITDGLHALSAMDANDIAIIFFAGHGVQSKDGRFWYVTQQGSLKQPESGGLDWQILGERISHIKGRVILFLDANCPIGCLEDETVDPNFQLTTKFFQGGMSRVMVFSASKGRQTSLENETIGGGLFTHYLTQGLTAKETDRDNNGFVEFMELVDYVSKAVNEKTQGMQTPCLISRNELFGDLAVATVQ